MSISRPVPLSGVKFNWTVAPAMGSPVPCLTTTPWMDAGCWGYAAKNNNKSKNMGKAYQNES
jgi:hypothetical protein